MITINLIKNDPIVRRAVQLKQAQVRYIGSEKSNARYARFRANHLEERRAQDRANKRAERLKDPEKIRARSNAWRKENLELARELSRRGQVKWIAKPENRAAHNALGRAWYAANKKRARATRLLRNYGLTLEALDAMIERQSGLCAICLEPLRGGRYQHIDHDHTKPGTARGVLCSECNSAIGKLQDDPEIIIRAAEYVRNGGLQW